MSDPTILTSPFTPSSIKKFTSQLRTSQSRQGDASQLPSSVYSDVNNYSDHDLHRMTQQPSSSISDSFNGVRSVRPKLADLQEELASLHDEVNYERSSSTAHRGTQPKFGETEEEQSLRDQIKILRRERDNLRDNRSMTNYSVRRFGDGPDRKLDQSVALAKDWKKIVLSNDVNVFPEWNYRAAAFFAGTGTPTIMLMDPYKVPKSYKDWLALDENTRDSDIYRQLLMELRSSSINNVSIRFSKESTMIELNAAYLAVASLRQGLAEFHGTTITSTIHFKSLRKCLLPSSCIATDVTARAVYFNVYNHFMRITEKTRLERLTRFTNGFILKDPESVKTFADRLSIEADLLNVMSKGEVVSQQLLMAVFKNRVYDRFGDTGKYYVKKNILESQDPDFTFDDLVDTWESVWLDEKDAKGSLPQTVFSASTSQNVLSSQDQAKQRTSDPRQKTKITKDKSGKNICFQFAKNGQCNFGSKCKYSHNVDATSVSAYSATEVDSMIMQQVYSAAVSHTKKKMQTKFKKKFKDYRSKSQSDSKGSKVSFKPGGSPNYQDAIKKHAAKVNAASDTGSTTSSVPDPATVSDADETVDLADSLLSSSESDSDSSDDAAFESLFAIIEREDQDQE